MTTPTLTREAPSSLGAIMDLQDQPSGGNTIADMIEDAAPTEGGPTPETEASSSSSDTIEIVTVSEMGKTVDVPLEPGMTIFDTLEAAEINPAGYSIRLNGPNEVSGDTVLNPGDSVILARQIRGA